MRTTLNPRATQTKASAAASGPTSYEHIMTALSNSYDDVAKIAIIGPEVRTTHSNTARTCLGPESVCPPLSHRVLAKRVSCSAASRLLSQRRRRQRLVSRLVSHFPPNEISRNVALSAANRCRLSSVHVGCRWQAVAAALVGHDGGRPIFQNYARILQGLAGHHCGL